MAVRTQGLQVVFRILSPLYEWDDMVALPIVARHDVAGALGATTSHATKDAKAHAIRNRSVIGFPLPFW